MGGPDSVDPHLLLACERPGRPQNFCQHERREGSRVARLEHARNPCHARRRIRVVLWRGFAIFVLFGGFFLFFRSTKSPIAVPEIKKCIALGSSCKNIIRHDIMRTNGTAFAPHSGIGSREFDCPSPIWSNSVMQYSVAHAFGGGAWTRFKVNYFFCPHTKTGGTFFELIIAVNTRAKTLRSKTL